MAPHRAAVRDVLDRDVPGLPPDVRRDVVAFVAAQLHALPLHLRTGVDAVGTAATLAARVGVALPAVGPIRQYRRLVRSLSVFAAHEPRPW